MTNLLRAELNRLRSRRLALAALLIVLVAMVGLLILVNDTVTPPPPAEQASAQAEYERANRGWEIVEKKCADNTMNDVSQCSMTKPQLSDFGGQLDYQAAATEALSSTVALIALVGFIVGASMIGAEYSTGTIGNWVTHMPRRSHVFIAKIIALALGTAIVTILASAVILAGTAILVTAHGEKVHHGSSVILMGGRGVLIAVALTAVGFCVALLGRHTAAALGLLIAYLFLWYVRGSVLNEAQAGAVDRWTPDGTLKAILENGYEYTVPVGRGAGDDFYYDFVPHYVTVGHGLAYWAVLLLGVVGAAFVVFRRRDLS